MGSGRPEPRGEGTLDLSPAALRRRFADAFALRRPIYWADLLASSVLGWGAFGLRYHGLHHLLPSLPYHGLGAVHRALLAELPADSPYRRAEAGGLVAALRELLGSARAHQHERA